MKKVAVLFFLVFALFFSVRLYAYAEKKVPRLASKAIGVIVDGKSFSGASIYKVSDRTNYFSVKEIAKIYGAALEWKPVSSHVTLRLANGSVDIKAGSTKVVFGKKEKIMSLPSRLIKDDIYIPPEILTSKEFMEIAGADSVWDTASLVLNVTCRANITALKYLTMPEKTQVLICLAEPLSYTVSKSSDVVIVRVLRGRIRSGQARINGGIIREVAYRTEGRCAVIRIALQQAAARISDCVLSKPDRICVDIVHSKNAAPISLKKTVIMGPDTGTEAGADIKTAGAVADGGKTDLPPLEKYGQERINTIASLVENAEDAKDLRKVPVAKFEYNGIIDESSKITEELLDENAVSYRRDARNFNGKKKIIVLDAGHGGEDTGAIGPCGTKEKDINLAIIERLRALFETDGGYEIVLTRNGDVFIPLTERTNIANKKKADLFISVHCNANFDRSMNSFEVYVLSERATDPGAAATAVLENSVLEIEGKAADNSLLKNTFWSMGALDNINDSLELCSFIIGESKERLKIPVVKEGRRANFYVLRGARMPAVLVESAFISNYAQEKKFSSKKFLSAIADCIYEGVVKYYARKDRREEK
jgi:N-acetylmuramoyl-L-alanine amidase